MTFDIVFFDSVGMPYNGRTPSKKGLGGSEFGVILLAEELVASGRRVAVFNNTNELVTVNGVSYAPQHDAPAFVCDTLILCRYSRIPTFSSRQSIVWATDMPDESYRHIDKLFARGNTRMVVLSDWQKDLFSRGLYASWTKHVIPLMLPSEVYETSLAENPKNFVYASAALKGLSSTLEVWREIVGKDNPRELELHVCVPGYDAPNPATLGAPGVRYLGSLPFHQVAMEMLSSAGIFYVNTFSETFCIVAALAEALKRRTHILCLSDPGALPSTISSPLLTTNVGNFLSQFEGALQSPNEARWYGKAKDYRPATVVKKWLELIES